MSSSDLVLRRTRPVQMLVQKLVGSLAVDRMRPDEPFDFGPVADLQLSRIEISDFSVFVSDPVVFADTVEVASFHHKRSRADQRGHLSVVERAAEIPFEDFVLARPDVTEALASTRVLQHPFVEVG